MLLDVYSLPREAWYGEGDFRLDLARLVFDASGAIDVWAPKGVITPVESFGFVAAHPDSYSHWDDPNKFVWFVTGWGPKQHFYIANAVNKLRAALRCQCDTLDLLRTPDEFRDVVGAAGPDNPIVFGDFPKAGAVLVRYGDIVLPAATSCFPQVEDPAATMAFGGLVAARMLSIQDPEQFGRPQVK
jgi:hypothetical protein